MSFRVYSYKTWNDRGYRYVSFVGDEKIVDV